MRNVIILVLCTFLLCLTSCKNEKSNNNQQREFRKESFDKPSSLLDYPSQFFEISTDKDTMIIGEKGTRISIKKRVLDTENKIMIVELKEYYSLPEMLLKELSTTSDEKILETDGMIYLNVETLVGDPVNLGDVCIVEMPSSKDGMGLFYGKEREGVINWKISNNDKELYSEDTVAFYQKDTLYNMFHITQLGWINADKFLEYENKTDLIVKLPEDQEGGVYSLAFYNYNSILPGIPNDKGELVFKGVPTGEKVSLIGIGAKEETLYYSILDLTTDTKNAELPELQQTNKKAFQTLMENRFGNTLAERPKAKF